MCKITIDTVRRANEKTIMQIGKKRFFSGSTAPRDSFNVSVSVMGKIFGQNIPVCQINRTFSEAIKFVPR